MADTNISAVAALNLVTTASKAGKTVQQVMSAKSTGFDFKNVLGKQAYNGTNDKNSVGRADGHVRIAAMYLRGRLIFKRRMTADCQRLMPMKLLKECHRR